MRRTLSRWMRPSTVLRSLPPLACVAPLTAVALVLALQARPAGADDAEQLQQRLVDLQGDYADLRVQLAQSDGMTPSQVANYENRLSAFEQELRNLTGMVEQVTYQQNQLSQRLDRMQADMEYRLSTLEGGQPVGSAAPAATPSGSSGAVTPAPEPKTLGTVSQDQLTLAQGSAPAQVGLGAAAAGTQSTTAPATGTQSAAAVALPNGTPKEQYDYAFGLLRKADYAGAETALKQFISAHPKDPLVANAKYWLGETYYVRGQFQDAASAFGVAYQDHPDGPKAVDSLLKLGLSLGQLGNNGDACAVFQELEKRFPNAPANVLQRSKQERGRLSC